MGNIRISILTIIIIGIGATLTMDAWAYLQKRWFDIPSLNYALVGRWVYYLSQNQYLHKPITQTPTVHRESTLGWVLHYLIGIIFSLGHVCVFGLTWLEHPSLLPALGTGVATLIFPFFIMQPCLGFGIAASQTPKPWQARFLSLLAHTAYAIGLFIFVVGINIVKNKLHLL